MTSSAPGTNRMIASHQGSLLGTLLRRWGKPLAFLLVFVTHPLTWNAGPFAAWSPPAGLGVLLVAWVGTRTATTLLLAGSGCVLLRYLFQASWDGHFDPAFVGWIGGDAVATVLEAVLGWWLFHTQAGGSRRLSDPRSAMLFVMVIPFLGALGGGLVRLGLSQILGLAPELPWSLLLSILWLGRALGILVLVPPALVLCTPWLLRHGVIAPEFVTTPPPWFKRQRRPETSPDQEGGRPITDHEIPVEGKARKRRSGPRVPIDHESAREAGPTFGDWVEMAGLALGASVMSLILTQLQSRRELMGWQLWGVQLLLIVWASLRQGLRGGTLTAASSALVPLLVFSRLHRLEDSLFLPLIQAHLAAQCSAALLVAAAASFARMHEAGYRQIVAHVPVIIYSARLPRLPAEAVKPNAWQHSLPEITLVSAACGHLLGVTPEHLLGDYSRWLECVHPEDHVIVLAALEQLGRQKGPVTCEYRLATTLEPPTSKRKHDRPQHEPDASANLEVPAPNRTGFRWLRDTLVPTRDQEDRLIGWEGVVIEVTEQRSLADDLRRTTSMFHALVSNLPTGVFFVQGPHGLPILLNSRARQLLGTREDATLGLEYFSRVYRLHRPDGTLYPSEELPVSLALTQGRSTMRDDIVVHRPDGRKTPLVTWAAPVNLGTRGGPDCAVWVLEDLTALHQAEAALRDSEGKLRAVIETMAEALLVLDGHGVVVRANSSAGALLGIDAEQMLGKNLSEFEVQFLEEDGRPVLETAGPWDRVLQTGEPVRNQIVGIQSRSARPRVEADQACAESPLPAEVRWVLVNVMPLVDNPTTIVVSRYSSQGRLSRPQHLRTTGSPVAGVVATLADITAHVQARGAIQQSETRYRELVESLPVILLQTDRNLRVVFANPALTTITGYALGEVAEPEQWAQILLPEDVTKVQDLGRNVLGGATQRLEIRYLARNGGEKVAYMFGQPRLGPHGTLLGTTLLLLDVTRERALEKELERARRLELIGRLSSGITHDFNNLLNVVLTLTELARRNLPGEHPVHADLQRISDAGEQAAHLATQLLTLGRQRRVSPRRVVLNQTVRRTLDLLRSTMPTNIEVEEVMSEEETAITCDESQLQQVLMNLCLNARDAMPHGGKLLIRTAIQDGGQVNGNGNGSLAGKEVCLSVEDTGEGISEEARLRIFEPFYSTKEGGTGLGLAVVQQIVESFGGRVEVHSTAGQGTRIEVRWPRAGTTATEGT